MAFMDTTIKVARALQLLVANLTLSELELAAYLQQNTQMVI
jgi:hypothetical protein